MEKNLHKIKVKSILISTVQSAILLAFSTSYAEDLLSEPESSQPIAVTVKKLAEVTVSVERNIKGQITSTNDALLSSELASKVIDLPVKAGQYIQKGAVLAKLDCQNQHSNTLLTQAEIETVRSRIAAAEARVHVTTSQLQSAKAAINSAQAKLKAINAQTTAFKTRLPSLQEQQKVAQNQLNRTQQLLKKKLIPINQFEQAQATFAATKDQLSLMYADLHARQAGVETAKNEVTASTANFKTLQAEINAAKANLNTIKSELKTATEREKSSRISTQRCYIIAPFNGQITARHVQIGQFLTVGTPAFQILQTGAHEIVGHLSLDEITDQKQSKEILFVSNTTKIRIRPRAVIAQIDLESKTQEVRYHIMDKHNLPSGTQGRIKWRGILPAVPPKWLVSRQDTLGLMLVENNKAKFHPLPNAQEDQPVLVDLPKDTVIIDQGRYRIKNGDRVDTNQ